MENIHTKLEKQNENFVYYNIRRPVSLYDDWKSSGNKENQQNKEKQIKINLKRSRTFHDPSDSKRSPSFVYTLNTTVPQNVKNSLSPERHIPTRSSLRHSRMIVLKHQSSKVSYKYLPPVIRYHRSAKNLVILQIVLGILITCISIWLVVYTPNLYIRDIPYWSGVPLILAGFSGYVLLYCCRKEYPGMKLNCAMFLYKIFSLTLSVLACILCYCAALFAIFQLTFLFYSKCEDVVTTTTSTCLCAAEHIPSSNLFIVNLMRINTKLFVYSYLNCVDVRGKLTFIVLGLSILNATAGILLFWYVYLHWKSRYLYIYSQVPMSVKPSIIANK